MRLVLNSKSPGCSWQKGVACVCEPYCIKKALDSIRWVICSWSPQQCEQKCGMEWICKELHCPRSWVRLLLKTQMIATSCVGWGAGKEPGELANLHSKSSGQELQAPAVRPGLQGVSKNTWGACFRNLLQEFCSGAQTNNLEDFPEIPVVMARLCLWLLPIFTSAWN